MREERLLTTPVGIPGRPWFRHQVYAPGINTGYAAQFLPGIRDALDAGDAATVTRYRDLLLDSLRDAAAAAGGDLTTGCRFSHAPVRLIGDHPHKEDAMKYMLLIHQGTTPRRGPRVGRLSEEEQGAVYADYQAINETPGVTPGDQMQPPETATTVRVQDGQTLTTDGPFVETKEALGGYLFFEADDLDAAIELAARIPAARMGGAIEVRPIVEW